MHIVSVQLPLSEAVYSSLHEGDKVLLSGVIYTARDAAHKRIVEAMHTGEELPFPLQDAVIFYAGPSPAKPGEVCGSIGPTTSGRMDAYTPPLLAAGVKVLIGKGERNQEVTQAIRLYHAVYLSAVGGAAALLAQCVKECSLLAYPELGAEAVYRLVVQDFPCYVTII